MTTCHCDGPPHDYDPTWCRGGRDGSGRPIVNLSAHGEVIPSGNRGAGGARRPDSVVVHQPPSKSVVVMHHPAPTPSIDRLLRLHGVRRPSTTDPDSAPDPTPAHSPADPERRVSMRELFVFVGIPLAIALWALARPGPFPRTRVHGITYPPLETKRERQRARRAGRRR